jgi:hypothetical protein
VVTDLGLLEPVDLKESSSDSNDKNEVTYETML